MYMYAICVYAKRLPSWKKAIIIVIIIIIIIITFLAESIIKDFWYLISVHQHM